MAKLSGSTAMNSVLTLEKQLKEKNRYLDLIINECQNKPMVKTSLFLKQRCDSQEQEDDPILALQQQVNSIRNLTIHCPAVQSLEIEIETQDKNGIKKEITPPVLEIGKKRRFWSSTYLRDDYVEQFRRRVAQRTEINMKHLNEAYQVFLRAKNRRIAYEGGIYKALLLEEFMPKSLHAIEEVQISSELIPLTKVQQDRLMELSEGPLEQVIVTKFKLDIHRSEIKILTEGAWLNDVIINFYMNLLAERSEKRPGQVPSVYAMNTFFVPRLLQSGFDGVKRWTRKVDLFSKDIILVPVHHSGVHWCLVVIDLRAKTMLYYNSKGGGNPKVMRALKIYLRMESLDKRQKPLDTNDFRIEHAQNVPQQDNMDDCGVFTCMFAEYLTRDALITFCKDDMNYFRIKMVLEIADGELWK
ncbi:sentrin-specific protease 1 [Drosophila teissieri]|uniref:sentrin-specific protease 1 n=1 Tax=Drosophila teissieri TaxID=7243 RepID=UPI001CBA2A42|nr:sentrin-specific protease 1 [Drosophila teissieri]